jgi:hypothetical protein
MTGFASVETAVEAIKLGATDYLSKPLDFARLEQLLAGVRDDLERRRNLLSIESDVARRLEFCGMIGRGPVMQELFGMIRRLAPHVRTALVTGETGTGKELFARALHTGPAPVAGSSQQLFGGGRDAVRASCSATCAVLHRRDREQAGAVDWPTTARSSVEIGELPASVQACCYACWSRRNHRVGSLEPRKVNITSSLRPIATCARKWP